MRDYELTVLFHPDLEVNPDPAVEKVKKIITQAGGKITKEENEGKKRMAYQIAGQTFALYYFANLSLPVDAPDKIAASLNIADEVIRFLLVRADERKAKSKHTESKSADRHDAESVESDEPKDRAKESSEENKEEE